jgi:hypothetical protein
MKRSFILGGMALVFLSLSVRAMDKKQCPTGGEGESQKTQTIDSPAAPTLDTSAQVSEILTPDQQSKGAAPKKKGEVCCDMAGEKGHTHSKTTKSTSCCPPSGKKSKK